MNKPAIAASMLLLLKVALASAQEADRPDFAQGTLTGDWNGRRAAWADAGVTLEGTYKVDHLNNLRGGIGKGSRDMTNLDIKLGADLDKLWGWEATRAYLHILDNRGASVNADKIGSQMGVSNIEVPVATSRIFHAWVEKSFMDERWALLAGLYPVDAEFSVVDSAGVFLHPAYGASQDLSQTRGPSIFNNSAFGLRLKWRSADKSLYAMAAILDGIPGDPDHPKRTAIRFDKGATAASASRKSAGHPRMRATTANTPLPNTPCNRPNTRRPTRSRGTPSWPPAYGATATGRTTSSTATRPAAR